VASSAACLARPTFPSQVVIASEVQVNVFTTSFYGWGREAVVVAFSHSPAL
jgi:hypothetical protein